jgi:hypothetical protein
MKGYSFPKSDQIAIFCIKYIFLPLLLVFGIIICCVLMYFVFQTLTGDFYVG